MAFHQIKDLIERLKSPIVIPEDPTAEDIQAWRKRIDEIDQGLLELMNERSRSANVIGHIKQKLGLPIYVPNREEEVLDNVRKGNPGPLADASVRRLFERIIDETRSLERQKYQDESE